MGAWGFYDDENDSACDAWCEVLDLLEKNTKMNIYQCIEQWILDQDETDTEEYNYILLGVCIKAIKHIQGDINADPLATGIIFCVTNHHLPAALPDDFPTILKAFCLDAVNYLIQRVDQNMMGWGNLQCRKSALQEELKYFT